MNFLNVSQSKPIRMDSLDNKDLYVLMEVNLDGVVNSEPMNKNEILSYLLKKYSDVSIRHLNESGRLKIIHLKTSTWKQVRVTLDLM